MEFERWIIEQIQKDGRNVAHHASKQFQLTRQQINRKLNDLVSRGIIEAKGHTKARVYNLAQKQHWNRFLAVTPDLEEHVIWRREIAPTLAGLPRNVVDICQHGFTEMLNNVVSHSESRGANIGVTRNAAHVQLFVIDEGIGIFHKIQTAKHLEDARHAILELSKGKLTTDPVAHSGEGVFFTSRMFDEFQIRSSGLVLLCAGEENVGDWLFEVNEKPGETLRGTHITMKLRVDSPKTRQGTMDQFARPELDDYGFSRTHVPVTLVKYGAEQLISRSQAKRLLARFELFAEILLDFRGVDAIGQAFADEIFRVFKNAHPNIRLEMWGANPEVMRMISHVQAGARTVPQPGSRNEHDKESGGPDGWSPSGPPDDMTSIV